MRITRSWRTNLLTALLGLVNAGIISSCSGRAESRSFQHRISDAVNGAASGIVAIKVFRSAGAGEEGLSGETIGAGVIIDAEGNIVTTHSLMTNSDSVIVMFQDGCLIPAKILGADWETNLAMLGTSPHQHGCYPVAVSQNKTLAVGDLALILGYTSLTKGVAVGLGVLSESWIGGDDFWGAPLWLIQSGELMTQVGAGVVGLDGELLGICDNRIAGYQGVWTVIPITTILKVKSFLYQGKPVPRGWLGMLCHCPQDDDEHPVSQAYLVILNVIEGSPAAAAGLEPGDLIYRLDGELIQDDAEMRRRITAKKPGEWVTLTVEKEGGIKKDIRVQLANIGDEPYRTRRCSSRSI